MAEDQELLRELRAAGYRRTPQREMILDAIHKAGGHFNAELVYNAVRAQSPYVNRSTVYRTLDLFKEIGLVVELQAGNGQTEYELASVGDHHHLVCRSCGKTIELADHYIVSFTEDLRKDYDFDAEIQHLAISGWCADCRSGG